jgi:hypothetical protein
VESLPGSTAQISPLVQGVDVQFALIVTAAPG